MVVVGRWGSLQDMTAGQVSRRPGLLGSQSPRGELPRLRAAASWPFAFAFFAHRRLCCVPLFLGQPARTPTEVGGCGWEGGMEEQGVRGAGSCSSHCEPKPAGDARNRQKSLAAQEEASQ